MCTFRMLATPAWFFALVTIATGCITRGELDDLKSGQDKLIVSVNELKADVASLRSGLQARPAPPPLPAEARQPDPAKIYSVAIGDAPVKGPATAAVTIVTVSDFQCPFCQTGRERLQEILQAYGQDVRVVFKHNPLSLHPRAMPAAIAAECARQQQKFWPYHDKLFDNQKALGDAELLDYAKQVGLKTDLFGRCLADAASKKRVEADQAAMRTLGATATPSFFINGRFISGARRLPVFRALIDEELKKAKESGIPAAAYYQKAVIERGERSM